MSESEKCTKNNCSACQEWLKEKLTSCEDWEVKRKESYRKFELRFCQTNSGRNYNNEISYPETGGYSYLLCPDGCGKMAIKKNDWGDQTEIEHECSNQIKSNQNSNSILNFYSEFRK